MAAAPGSSLLERPNRQGIWWKVLPVDLLGFENQIAERSRQQRFDPGNGPGRKLDGGSARDDGLQGVRHDAIDRRLEFVNG